MVRQKHRARRRVRADGAEQGLGAAFQEVVDEAFEDLFFDGAWCVEEGQ